LLCWLACGWAITKVDLAVGIGPFVDTGLGYQGEQEDGGEIVFFHCAVLCCSLKPCALVSQKLSDTSYTFHLFSACRSPRPYPANSAGCDRSSCHARPLPDPSS